LAVASRRNQADHVNVGGGPLNEAEQQQAAAPNNQHTYSLIALSQ
jgi:hypothetical protein